MLLHGCAHFEYAVGSGNAALIRQVLAALSTPTATNVRNRAIFLTLLDTGIRASELLTLTLQRARLDEGYLLVLGKGKKERPVKIGTTAAAAMRTYIMRSRRTCSTTCSCAWADVPGCRGAAAASPSSAPHVCLPLSAGAPGPNRAEDDAWSHHADHDQPLFAGS